MICRPCILCLLVLLAAALPAFLSSALAQDEAAENVEYARAFEDDEIVVSARRINESVDDPPVFVDIIEMDQFSGRFVTTEEAISQAAGVNVRSFGGLGKLSTISIRGSSANQVVVLVDGVRINPAVGGGVDLSTIPPEHIERIEVIRGGDSAFYGEGAVGGVVNIVTKKCAGEDTNTIAVTYGSFNTGRVAATRSQGFEKTSYFVSGTYLHSDGNFPFINNNGTEYNKKDDYDDIRENNETDSGGLLVKVDRNFGAHLNLAGQNEFFISDIGVPGMVTFPSPHVNQRDMRNTSTFSFAVTDLITRGLNFNTRLSHRFASTDYDDRQGEQTGVPLETYQEEYAPEAEQSIQYIWGTHQIWTLSGIYGLNFLKDEEFDDPQRTTWAAALRDQIFLFNEILTIVPAVRYDDVSDMGNQWSPKFGLSIKPLDWLVLKGNAGRSFRAPNFNEMYYNHGFVEGNPDLKPERATNVDAGLQIPTPWFFVEGAYFRSDVEDLIEYVLISGFRYKPYNIGQARLEGMESLLKLYPVRYFTLTGSYTLTYAIDTTDYPNRTDRQIPGRPRHKGFGRLEGHLSSFHPFVEYHYIGGNFITQANTKLLPERQIVNAGLVVEPGEGFKTGFEVKNVADEQAVDVRGFPLPGRSFFVNFEANF
ncbi:MAG TPA: TonB-dependent receptor [bacterium]|nr:TonB-dependent receptor [bacterium]